MRLLIESGYSDHYILPVGTDLSTAIKFLESAVKVQRIGYDSPAKYEIESNKDGSPAKMTITLLADDCLEFSEESWKARAKQFKTQKDTAVQEKWKIQTELNELKAKYESPIALVA